MIIQGLFSLETSYTLKHNKLKGKESITVANSTVFQNAAFAGYIEEQPGSAIIEAILEKAEGTGGNSYK